MFNQYLQDQNWLALILATLAYWTVGAAWFSFLFGKTWMAEQEKNGTRIERPSKQEFMGMMIGNFIYNLLIVFGISYIVFITGCIRFDSALKMGALIGVCISFSTLGSNYIWVKKSMKLLLLDGGYHAAGSIIAALILGLWR
jgi:hypothetical protein